MERNGNDKVYCQAYGALRESRWRDVRLALDELLERHRGAAIDKLPTDWDVDMPPDILGRVREWNHACDDPKRTIELGGLYLVRRPK